MTSSPLFLCSWSLDDGFEALTCVGAFDKTYKKMEKSNYGPQVFLWAPGQSVRTAHWTDPNKEWAGSQTSAAAPSVAGIVATMVGFEGLKNKGDPKRVHDLLKENGLPGRFVTFTRDGGYGVLFANNGMNSGSSPYKGAPKDELRRRMA